MEWLEPPLLASIFHPPPRPTSPDFTCRPLAPYPAPTPPPPTLPPPPPSPAPGDRQVTFEEAVGAVETPVFLPQALGFCCGHAPTLPTCVPCPLPLSSRGGRRSVKITFFHVCHIDAIASPTFTVTIAAYKIRETGSRTAPSIGPVSCRRMVVVGWAACSRLCLLELSRQGKDQWQTSTLDLETPFGFAGSNG